MSLLYFHRFLIACAIVFCAGFSFYELQAFQSGGGALALAVSAGFALAAITLAIYLRSLIKFLGLEGSARRPRSRSRSPNGHS